jgi:Flp pilus assembly pilin Flp
MKKIMKNRQRGVSSVEYIIILVLIAVTGIAVFKTFGGKIKEKMDIANTKMGDVNAQ